MLTCVVQNAAAHEGDEVQIFAEAWDLCDLDFFTVSDPFCTLKMREKFAEFATWRAGGETEVIDNNLNPKWLKHFDVRYKFERDSEMWFQVWHFEDANDRDKNQLIGETTFLLSELMMHAERQVTKVLYVPDKPGVSRGNIKIRGDIIKKSDDMLRFQISADLRSQKFLCCGSDNPYL